ncbi:hypothetical protein SCP_1601550 [Sparassis crispa]|uniref:Uncharacterized protein n=1 Tax=Sparassis crispa TaxID=139825 RepID=A0A401H517_9APHY|nr:hypothetical protein SCP_1601550 [Sparassis crispa]GBE89493.1 hypothetical protein SCP_1601550 [Sparassis crispa]
MPPLKVKTKIVKPVPIPDMPRCPTIVEKENSHPLPPHRPWEQQQPIEVHPPLGNADDSDKILDDDIAHAPGPRTTKPRPPKLDEKLKTSAEGRRIT